MSVDKLDQICYLNLIYFELLRLQPIHVTSAYDYHLVDILIMNTFETPMECLWKGMVLKFW